MNLTSPPTPTYRAVTITPDLAREWLKKNTRNRALNPRRVDVLAGAMQRNEWHENGDAIRFSTTDVLLDGQTRLAAVIKSGVSIRCLIVEQLPDEAQITMDVGASRTFAANLHIQGIKNPGHMAALARLMFKYETGQMRNHNRLSTHAQLQGIVDRNHAAMEESLRVALAIRRQLPVSTSVIALAHWVFIDIDLDDTAFFFDRLRDGQGLVEGDPIFALRKALLLNAVRDRGHEFNQPHVMALIIKAWNAYRSGAQMKLLQWRSGGSNPEAFPEPK